MMNSGTHLVLGRKPLNEGDCYLVNCWQQQLNKHNLVSHSTSIFSRRTRTWLYASWKNVIFISIQRDSSSASFHFLSFRFVFYKLRINLKRKLISMWFHNKIIQGLWQFPQGKQIGIALPVTLLRLISFKRSCCFSPKTDVIGKVNDNNARRISSGVGNFRYVCLHVLLLLLLQSRIICKRIFGWMDGWMDVFFVVSVEHDIDIRICIRHLFCHILTYFLPFVLSEYWWLRMTRLWRQPQSLFLFWFFLHFLLLLLLLFIWIWMAHYYFISKTNISVNNLFWFNFFFPVMILLLLLGCCVLFFEISWGKELVLRGES